MLHFILAFWGSRGRKSSFSFFAPERAITTACRYHLLLHEMLQYVSILNGGWVWRKCTHANALTHTHLLLLSEAFYSRMTNPHVPQLEMCAHFESPFRLILFVFHYSFSPGSRCGSWPSLLSGPTMGSGYLVTFIRMLMVLFHFVYFL